jgi:hypothetical protein
MVFNDRSFPRVSGDHSLNPIPRSTFARSMNRQAWLRVSFAVIGVVIGCALVIDKRSSELAIWNLTFLLLLPIPIGVLWLLLAEKWKVLLHIIILPALLGYLAFQGLDWFYWPRNIRFQFSSPGATGSFHRVQFQNQVGDQWVDGPSVEGWPMRVSFPDLDSDGYDDIRIVEESGRGGDVIEFLYIPNSKDGVYWKAHRMDSRLSASYRPAGICHRCP